MTEHNASSQAGLASFMPPQPYVSARGLTVYAAVIEWPARFTDAEPSLILARTERERGARIADEIRETAEALIEPDWRNALAAMSHTDNWQDWLDALDLTSYGQPFVTTYEGGLTVGTITATFTIADPTPDDVLNEYTGQRVTVLGPSVDAQRIRFADGTEGDAFNEELTEWRLEK